jgi:hypothetical protein
MTNVYSIMGLISTIFIFLPVLLMLVLKMTGHRNFMALTLYYISALIYNAFTLKYITVPTEITYNYGLVNNLLDAPLMLFFISYFSTSVRIRKFILRFIAVYILFEIVVVLSNGLNGDTMAIIIGPGLFSVMGLSIHFFLQQTKRAIRNPKANGKALLAAATIFSYGCYIFLYLMFYVFKTHVENGVINQQSVADTYLLYYIGTIISSSILCAGIIIESKRVQQLFEMKLTRKELSAIYTNKKAATPFRAALLDFDKELLKNNTYPH